MYPGSPKIFIVFGAVYILNSGGLTDNFVDDFDSHRGLYILFS